jgi:hypothetical protein
MINPKLMEITRRLILAEKRMARIDTIYPASLFHMREIPKIAIQSIPSLPALPALPSLPALPVQMQLNLGKLNPFVNDNSIRAIECPGAGKNLRIKKEFIAETSIQLTESEVMEIVSVFAKAAGIPMMPVLKAEFGNLIINAFISPAFGSKFLILKKT